jgi:hypothetical protein
MDQAHAMARHFASAHPAWPGTKAPARSPAHTLQQQLELERDSGGLGHSRDYREGVSAFLEKRAAQFTGREMRSTPQWEKPPEGSRALPTDTIIAVVGRRHGCRHRPGRRHRRSPGAAYDTGGGRRRAIAGIRVSLDRLAARKITREQAAGQRLSPASPAGAGRAGLVVEAIVEQPPSRTARRARRHRRPALHPGQQYLVDLDHAHRRPLRIPSAWPACTSSTRCR